MTPAARNIVLRLTKEDAETIAAQLDGSIHAAAAFLSENHEGPEVDAARDALQGLLRIVGSIEQAAADAGVVLERAGVE